MPSTTVRSHGFCKRQQQQQQQQLSFFIKVLLFGYCLHANNTHNLSSSLPIDTPFTFPSPLPTWPPGGGFGSGEIDLGGLQVRQVRTFRNIYTGQRGGSSDTGVSFFEPDPMPEGFSMLATYAQPNDRKLFGWVLVGKTDARDESSGGDILKQPTDYTLFTAYNASGANAAYFWLPVPPDGYKAVGHVVTTSMDKPPLNKISCVRSDFTDEVELGPWIWTVGDNINAYMSRPKTRGDNAAPVDVGTFLIQMSTGSNSYSPMSCLKTKKSSTSSSSKPNLSQIEAMFQTYSPYIYLHPDEAYQPSSVNWYFQNGALLYTRGQEGNPAAIQPNGTNLPPGGSNDGMYWMDLPPADHKKDAQWNVKKGDLQSAGVYLHVKHVFGGTFTDIQVWVFYPFNGHATARLGPIKSISLGRIGEHVGDWEHVTLRLSNFDGILHKVYFSQHGKGEWVDASLMEFQTGSGNNSSNRFVAYSALDSHASYSRPGVVMLGDGGGGGSVGIKDITAKSNLVLDTGARFLVVAGEEGEEGTAAEQQLPWLDYNREWGPNRTSELGREVEKIKKFLPGKLKSEFDKLIRKLQDEVFRQEGPTGPKTKDNWFGDERDN